MSETVWASFALWQLIAIGACFIWSGFVRSGLGFGGAALTLPMLLIIHNDPLLYLPAIFFIDYGRYAFVQCQLALFGQVDRVDRCTFRRGLDWLA